MITQINLWDNYTGKLNDYNLTSYSEAVKMSVEWVNEHYPEKAPSNYKVEMEFNYYDELTSDEFEKMRKSIVILRGRDINRLRKEGFAL